MTLEPRLQKWGAFDHSAEPSRRAIAANWMRSGLALGLVVVSMFEIADNLQHPFLYAQF